MTIEERKDAGNNENIINAKERPTVVTENIEFLTLSAKVEDGITLTDQEQARFEELKQIRATRDEKYLVPDAFNAELGRLQDK